MAKLHISVTELDRILNSNNLLPEQISGMEADGDNIHLRIKTGWFALKSVRMSVKFINYKDENAVFEVVQNRFMNKFDWLIHKLAESAHLPEYINLDEYPKVHVDLNKVLAEKTKGIRLDDLSFEKGLFLITLSTL